MLLSIIYLIAISAEAMTGALSAGRRRMDLFGVVMIACVTALGGGSLRDILLGHYPLGWVKHPEYLGFTVFAALIATWVARWTARPATSWFAFCGWPMPRAGRSSPSSTRRGSWSARTANARAWCVARAISSSRRRVCECRCSA